MSPVMIIMGVIIIILLYMFFFYKTGETELNNKVDIGIPQTPIAIDSIVDPTASVYSFETWVYVSKYNGVGASLFYRLAAGDSTKHNIGVEVTGASPTLKVKYMDTNSAQQTIVVTDNFPVQSWVHVIVSLENRYIDVYVNGKLTKSIMATGVETPSPTNEIVYGNWSTAGGCSLAKFYRRTNATEMVTIVFPNI